jgi:hypothetical protein
MQRGERHRRRMADQKGFFESGDYNRESRSPVGAQHVVPASVFLFAAGTASPCPYNLARLHTQKAAKPRWDPAPTSSKTITHW